MAELSAAGRNAAGLAGDPAALAGLSGLQGVAGVDRLSEVAVVSEYIDRPALVESRKFDLRFYVAVRRSGVPKEMTCG